LSEQHSLHNSWRKSWASKTLVEGSFQ